MELKITVFFATKVLVTKVKTRKLNFSLLKKFRANPSIRSEFEFLSQISSFTECLSLYFFSFFGTQQLLLRRRTMHKM